MNHKFGTKGHQHFREIPSKLNTTTPVPLLMPIVTTAFGDALLVLRNTHATDVTVLQDVVRHTADATRTVIVLPALRKFTPDSVTDARPVRGVFSRASEITGAAAIGDIFNCCETAGGMPKDHGCSLCPDSLFTKRNINANLYHRS